MIVISDTGPIQYLQLLGQIELLRCFFGEVLIPSAVVCELTHPSTPEIVRHFATNLPMWMKEVSCPITDPRFDRFGLGEREALTLALQNPGPILLCDDGAARAAAIAQRIAICGTLGILRDAAISGLLDIRIVVEKLKTQTNFRGSESLFESVCIETERTLRTIPQSKSITP